MQDVSSNTYYDAHAAELVDQYESLDPAELHRDLLSFLPSPPGLVLDIGAGSGRDAAFLAGRGLFVVAVEPSKALRQHGKRLHVDHRIFWSSDSLPDLAAVQRSNLRFNFILVSAVWMHIPREQRQKALDTLSLLLAPNGKIAISLRLGVPDPSRSIYEVDVEELLVMSRGANLEPLLEYSASDKLGRNRVMWTTVVLSQQGVQRDQGPSSG